MKKCSSCGTELNEGYSLSTLMSWPVALSEKDFRGKSVGSIVGCVCPKCGKIELYLHKKH